MIRTVDRFSPEKARAGFAWAGALCMLLLLLRAPATAWFTHFPASLLPLVAAAAVMLWLLATRRLQARPANAGCALLGALFTSISFCLTMVFGRLLG